jgi:DNA-binding transcriptional MerR regulator
LEKAPDAFRTISEVAEEINVPQHVLRFWESRFVQIRPLKRGGGRRYYRPDDVDLLRGVRHLLYGEGYTIRGVQRILREEGLAFVQNVWRPGAEPPPPDDADGETEPHAPREPAFFGRPSQIGEPDAARADAREEPTILAPIATAPASFSDDNRRKLQVALDELVACQALIEAALADTPTSDD